MTLAYFIFEGFLTFLIWLALAVVIMSAVSAYFYLRVVAVMYFTPTEKKLRTASTPLLNVGIVGMVIANVALGPFFVFGWLGLPHMGIAGTGFASLQSDINASWASGWGVRLLDRLVADHYEK